MVDTIADHARAIERLLQDSQDLARVSFVTHSLGGLVVRELVGRRSAWRQRLPLSRIVMLAPPNRGSHLAERFDEFLLFLGGPAAQLTPSAVERLPVPDCEFAIIAGGNGTAQGANPLIEGDNDGLVALRETLLPGAIDFLRVDASHTFIMDHPVTVAAVLQFLATGRLRPRR
jgi:pimeloyl-ACP methyl ester carboxylesterase